MNRSIGRLLAVIFLLTMAGCTENSSQDASWLLGKWELAHNPEGDDEDVLIFDSDDTVTVLAEKGGKIQGDYTFDGDVVKILLPTERKIIEVEFDVSSDHSKLIYESGAYYNKH